MTNVSWWLFGGMVLVAVIVWGGGFGGEAHKVALLRDEIAREKAAQVQEHEAAVAMLARQDKDVAGLAAEVEQLQTQNQQLTARLDALRQQSTEQGDGGKTEAPSDAEIEVVTAEITMLEEQIARLKADPAMPR